MDAFLTMKEATDAIVTAGAIVTDNATTGIGEIKMEIPIGTIVVDMEIEDL